MAFNHTEQRMRRNGNNRDDSLGRSIMPKYPECRWDLTFYISFNYSVSLILSDISLERAAASCLALLSPLLELQPELH